MKHIAISKNSNRTVIRILQRLLGPLRFPYQKRSLLAKQIQGHLYLALEDWRVLVQKFYNSS